MRCLLLLATLASGPAAAQTCGGALSVPLQRLHMPAEAEAPLVVWPGRPSFDFEDGLPLRTESLRREPDE